MKVNGYEIDDCCGEYFFDEHEADERVWFIENHCWHSEGPTAGQKFKLADWQAPIVRALFGWKRTTTERTAQWDPLSKSYELVEIHPRRFRFLFLFLPRKNGKTALCSALTKCCLFMDGEPASQIVCAASSRDQAGHLYRMISHSIRQDPMLDALTLITPSQQRLTVGSDLPLSVAPSECRVIAAEAKTQHGANLHVSILDELHTWGGDAGIELYKAIRTGRANRVQPLLIMLSTAGIDFQSICYDQYEYARSILDGERTDPTYLPVIYEAAPLDDWQDEEIWRKANPNLGVTIQLETIREEASAAEGSHRAEAAFRQLYLNQWVSAATTWISVEQWKASEAADRECKPFPAGSVIYGGLDVGVSNDLTALCWLWIDGDIWRFRWQFFMPEEQVARLERSDGNPYRQWIDDGWIGTMGGRTLDDGEVIHAIRQASEFCQLAQLAYDPAHARYIVGSKSIDYLDRLKCPTSYGTMTEAMTRAEKLVADGKLDHGHNPVAQWCIDSTAARRSEDGQYMRPSKRTRDGARNDGAVAMLNSIVGALSAGEGSDKSAELEFGVA